MHNGNGVTDLADHLAALAYFVLIIGGLAGWAIRPARRVCGFVLYIASAAVAIDVWLWSALIVKVLWGTAAMVIGILLGIIGVIPMAMIASSFHGDWVPFGYLILNIVILYFMQFVAGLMMESHRKPHPRRV
jgi:uncharacterized protein YacL